MTKETTQVQSTGSASVLYLAFELSSTKWKLGFSIGFGQKARIRTIESGSLHSLIAEISAAKKRFRLPEGCEIVSCYEAGRDGFWLHRYLLAQGITNYIVDSSSIEVNRRNRRTKTDRIDVTKLLGMLMRYCITKELKVWSVVNVPSLEEEDRRQLHREISALEKEKNRTSNRIRGLLVTQGVQIKGALDLSGERLDTIRSWDGRPLPEGLKARIGREWAHLVFLRDQWGLLNKQRRCELRGKSLSEAAPDLGKMRQLEQLKAIGPIGAWLLVRELFGWRRFKNGKQVGSISGLTPTHYQSGDTNIDQGISKAGIRPVREIAIELAWGWIRYQPDSKLSRWYNERFSSGGKKARKIGIVAVARRLLIDLWRYLETGVIPEGAELKSFS